MHEALDGTIEGVSTEGFADDTVILATGRNIKRVRNKMQRALKIAEEWQNKHDLRFAPGKSVVIIFTRRRAFQEPEKLILNKKPIEYSHRHKHLGVYLDRKLSPLHHVEMKIKEGKAVITRLSSVMGKIWGLKPSMARWMYTSVARPIVTYASLIWHKAVLVGKNRDRLRKFQRFALMQLGYARHRTPGAALEVISNTMPLDLYVQYDAVCSYLRTRGHEKHTEDEMWTHRPLLKGHRQAVRDLAT